MRILAAIVGALLPALAHAVVLVTFSWDAVPGATGYKIYCGNTAGNYNAPVTVGAVTSAQVSLAQGKDWYCAVTATNGTVDSGYGTCTTTAFATCTGGNVFWHQRPAGVTNIRRGASLPTWPISLNVAGKYLQDAAGKPLLLVADAGWELTTQISDANAIAYLDDRRTRGFNAVEIRIIGRSFQSNAPNDFYGNAPFSTGTTNWSTPNPTYWARMDTILTAMKDRGMIALVFPAYLGYGCGIEGWCQEMLAQTNAAMTAYGQFIGNRYKNYGNIIWMTGGDANCALYTNACARNDAIVTAIRGVHTGAIFSVEPIRDTIGGIDNYTTQVDINAVYSGLTSPQAQNQTAYGASRPFMLQEAYYENEHSITLADLQSQGMLTYLGGGKIGYTFGTCPMWSFGVQVGFCDSASSPFNTWQNNLASIGSTSAGNMGKLMRSRKWWNLVPDYSNVVVTSTKGSGFSYRATAREATGETVMVWVPSGGAVTVDMTKISGSQATTWWWNPDDNTASSAGTFATTGTRAFTPPAVRRVLVLDAATANLAAPGSTEYQ